MANLANSSAFQFMPTSLFFVRDTRGTRLSRSSLYNSTFPKASVRSLRSNKPPSSTTSELVSLSRCCSNSERMRFKTRECITSTTKSRQDQTCTNHKVDTGYSLPSLLFAWQAVFAQLQLQKNPLFCLAFCWFQQIF